MSDRRRRILVIDDEPVLREAIVAALDPVQFRVVIAGGVPAAAKLCRRASFNLVVCARVDTLACFRANTRELPETPVLVLTRTGHSRIWTMTSAVRFAMRPRGVVELRELVASAVP